MDEEDELEHPSFWRRFLSWLLDMVIVIFAGTGVLWLFPDVFAAVENATFVVNAAIGFVYFGLLHGICGRSVGKMLGRTRLVRRDGGKVGVGQALWRAFWSLGIFGALELPRFFGVAGGWWGVLTDAGMLYLILNCICLVWDLRENRAVHDRLAGTRVVCLRAL